MQNNEHSYTNRKPNTKSANGNRSERSQSDSAPHGGQRSGSGSFRPRAGAHSGSRRSGAPKARKQEAQGRPASKAAPAYSGRGPAGAQRQPDRKPEGFAGFRPRGGRKPKQPKRVKATPARVAALEVLRIIREEEVFLGAALERVLPAADLKREDAAFARLLATEVVARRGTLDELIDSVLNDPSDVDAKVRDALRLSFCEVFYLDKPDHVAVDQGVELVRSVAPKAAGLANFTLRRAVEQKDAFPFGDPETDLRAASFLYGFPLWLAQRLASQFGEEGARAFMRRSNEPAPLFFMVNVARADGAQTLQLLVRKGLKIVPVPALLEERQGFPLFAFADRTAVSDPDVERLLMEGALVISDAAALSIAMLALPDSEPVRFLEIGAGRGTKSILLQNTAIMRYGKQMHLETLDMSIDRTAERTKRLKRARIEEAESHVSDATNLSGYEAGAYDAVFIDAPCSGVGTLRRHHDIRWRLDEANVASLAATGSAILEQAARLVAPGGRLTFATCTVFEEENQGVIEAFLASDAGADFQRVQEGATLALFDVDATGPLPDAHFVSVLQRRA